MAPLSMLHDDQPAIGPDLDIDAMSRGISADCLDENALEVRGHPSVIPATEINDCVVPHHGKLIANSTAN
jgi:hypothetical protein